MNVSTSSSDGRKSNHHSNALSRSRSPSASRKSPSSKRRASGPPPGHFGFTPQSGIDTTSPYGPFTPTAVAAMRSTIPGYTGLLGTSSPPMMPAGTPGSALPLPMGECVPTGSDNIPLPLYQSPLWQAAVRQQQLQLLGQIASLGASTNPFLSTPPAPPPPAPSHPTAQMPPTPSQVQAAAAAMLAAAGSGAGGPSFPPTTGIHHTPPSFAPPDSSSDDVPASGNAAALAALIAASVSTSSASPSSTSPVDSSVALRAYRDYLITNKLQTERSRELLVQTDKNVKQTFNSISSTLDKPGSDSTAIDSPTTSTQTSMPHSPAVLLMAEQFLRGKQSLSTTSTSSVTRTSPITSHPSVESTQAKIPMTPFNVRPNLSNQESSLNSKHDLLPPPYSSAHVASSPTSLSYRHRIINAEDAKNFNFQLQQQAEAATLVNKLLAEGSSRGLQPDPLSQNIIGVRSPEDLLPRHHPHHPHHRVGKTSLRSHQPQPQLVSNIAVSNSSPPSVALGIGDLLPAVTGGRGGRRDGRSNSTSRSSGAGPVAYNGRDKVFTCKICNRSFGYKHVLQNHERTHTGEKPFECKVCHKRFTRDHHLKTHMRLHTGEKPYNCTHCDRQFVQVANLRRHLRVHTGEKPYKCDLCDSRFSDSNQLKAHILIHKGEKPFNCDKCEGKFRRRHHLMHHVCPCVPKGGGNLPGSPGGGHEERHQMSPPPLLPLPPHLTRLSQTSDISAPTRGRKKQGYMQRPVIGVDSGPEELFKASSPYPMGKGPIGHFDEENLKAMLKAATAIGVAAASGVPQSPSSDNLPQASLELGLRMLRAAEADRLTKLVEYDQNLEEEPDSPTDPQTIPDTAVTIGSNGSGAGRSRKSRDPKRVRQSPTNYDDNIDRHQDVEVTPSSPTLITSKLLATSDLLESKNIPLKTGNEQEDDDNDDNDTPRSSTELDEDIQTEPQDLSARNNSMSSAGLSASIRVKSKQELNLLLGSTSTVIKGGRISPAGAKPHAPSSSIEPSEDDGKGTVVSTTGDEKEIFFGTTRNDFEPMEVDDEDEDDDNKENNSDTGTKPTNSTSDLTTGASPTTDIVAVTATASAASTVGVRANNVGGNGANNLHQLSIANN